MVKPEKGESSQTSPKPPQNCPVWSWPGFVFPKQSALHLAGDTWSCPGSISPAVPGLCIPCDQPHLPPEFGCRFPSRAQQKHLAVTPWGIWPQSRIWGGRCCRNRDGKPELGSEQGSPGGSQGWGGLSWGGYFYNWWSWVMLFPEGG